MNLKKFLQKTTIESIEENGEFYIQNFGYTFLNHKKSFINFPKIKDGEIDVDYEEEALGQDIYEDLDFENFSIIDIDFDDNSFTFCAGGDWQEPVEVKTMYENDEFYFEITGQGFSEGLDEEEFLIKVYGKNWEKTLEDKGYTDLI